MSSAFDPFLLFVSFVVKQFYAFAKDTSLFSSGTFLVSEGLEASWCDQS